jgi:hypothetical protein
MSKLPEAAHPRTVVAIDDILEDRKSFRQALPFRTAQGVEQPGQHSPDGDQPFGR